MKVQIESTPTISSNNEPLVILNGIINAALKSRSLDDFRNNIKAVDTFGFKIGFGGSHAWVQQNTQDSRMLFITEN